MLQRDEVSQMNQPTRNLMESRYVAMEVERMQVTMILIAGVMTWLNENYSLQPLRRLIVTDVYRQRCCAKPALSKGAQSKYACSMRLLGRSRLRRDLTDGFGMPWIGTD
jgi:hypothetical protein